MNAEQYTEAHEQNSQLSYHTRIYHAQVMADTEFTWSFHNSDTCKQISYNQIAYHNFLNKPSHSHTEIFNWSYNRITEIR